MRKEGMKYFDVAVEEGWFEVVHACYALSYITKYFEDF